MDHYRLLIFPLFNNAWHVQSMAVYHFFCQVNDEEEMAEGDMATLKAQHWSKGAVGYQVTLRLDV